MAREAQDDLRITDQFDFEVFWAKRGKQVTAAVVVIVAVGLILLYWQHETGVRVEQAADRLAGAMDVSSLEAVARDFPQSPTAAEALFRLADLYYRSGKYTEAANTYERITRDFPAHPLAQSAKLNLAAVLEAQGKLDEAKAQYEQIINSGQGSYVANAAKIGLARCLESKGQTKEARQMYEEVLAAGQNSPWFPQAYLRWVVLGRDVAPEKAAESPTAKPETTPSHGSFQFPAMPASP
jgi:tetratricopeptide (TPR) repeat protein